MAEALAVGNGELRPDLVQHHVRFRARFFDRKSLLRTGRRPWQYWASPSRAEGSSSARPVLWAKESAGRSVHDAGTAVRCPEGKRSTTHG